MFIARFNNVPTLNGYSGWEPAEWHLNLQNQGYLRNVGRWVRSNNIHAGLCGVDARDGSWVPIDFSTPQYAPGSIISFRRSGSAYLFEGKGWGEQEEGGTWALNDTSTLTLNLPRIPDTDLLLTLSAHAFLPGQRPHFEEFLRVNGNELVRWPVANSQFEEHVRLPRSMLASKRLQLEFSTRDAVSPADLHISTDGRKLSFAMEQLKLVPVSPPSQYTPGSELDFRWGGNGYLYEQEGWSQQEEGGSWTVNGRSTLRLDLAARPAADMTLSFQSHAFISDRRPSFTEGLEVNGSELARWTVSQPQLDRTVNVPARLLTTNSVRIAFVDYDPVSPAEVSVSKDQRKLGLALESLKLSESLHKPK